MDLLYWFFGIIFISISILVGALFFRLIRIYCNDETPKIKYVKTSDNPLLENST